MRNQIQHLAVPNTNLSKETLEFVVKVIDPILLKFWGERVFDDLIIDDCYVYEPDFLREILKENDIEYDGNLP